MNVSVIVIGDELLIGQVTDTNSGELARIMAPAGWRVACVQTVSDSADDIVKAIDRAFSDSDIVITTGGLGPTKDDITKRVLCDYFGGEMQLDNATLENVRAVVGRRGIALNKLTADQAIVPTSARIIQNEVGTAPIMWFERDDKVLVSMPGVPFETRQMFSQKVFPMLLQRFGSDVAIVHSTIIVTDYTESALATEIADWENALPPHLHLAYLPKPGVIRLRLDGVHPDADFIKTEVDRYALQLVAMLGDAVLAAEDLTPAEILLREAETRKVMIATAESCTGGNIAHSLTLIPGSSAAVQGGVVAYSNEVKRRVLGVSVNDLEKHGAVSIPVVEQMACGACEATGASLAMATSGIAGPGGGTDAKPVGTVCIGIAYRVGDRWNVYSETARFPGNRSRVIDAATTRTIILAIKMLRTASRQ